MKVENLTNKKDDIMESNKLEDKYPLLKELLWKDKYVESGINVMISIKTNYYLLEKNKRKLDEFDESSNTLIEEYKMMNIISK
ncbi:MAG: hypothetical protein ACFFG0_43400 [Candidatus Thorarchaeota archaeon]